jgi:hypothetical protein
LAVGSWQLAVGSWHYISRAKLPSSKGITELLFRESNAGFAEIAKSGGFDHN